MADSIRQQIITAIDTRLKTILTSNGYETNAGQNVFAWRDSALALEELEAILYKDRTEARTPGVGIYEITLPLEIQIIATSPAQVRKILADLEVAVMSDETWGGLALNTEFETDEMEIEQKEYTFVASGIILPIEYRTSRGNPYSIEPGTDHDAILIHNIDGWLSDFAMDCGVSREEGERVFKLVSQFDDSHPLYAPSDDTKKPLWIPDGLNGNPTIRFDGINDYLQSADFVWHQPCIAYIVCKVIAFTSSYDQIMSGGPNHINPPWVAMWDSNILIRISAPYAGPNVTISANTWVVLRVILNGGTSSIRKNIDSPSIGNPGTYGFEGITLGRQGGFDGNYSNIEIARLVCFSSVPSTAEDAFIMNALNTRYAIY